MSINPSNFIGFGTTDLGAIIQQQTSNQVTATFTFPTNTTTLNKQSVAFNAPIVITESQIIAQMDGTPLNGDQVYTFGPAIQNRTVLLGQSGNSIVFSNDGIIFNGLGVTQMPSSGSAGVFYDGFKWNFTYQSQNNAGYSYNGINWQTTGSLTTPGTNPWRIVYNGKIYVLILEFAPTGISYSYDGLNWINTPSPFSSNIYSLAWNGNYWLAGGKGGNTLTSSPDGIIWTKITTTPFSSFCSDICWMGDKWIIIGSNGGTPIISYNINPSGQGTWTTSNTTLFTSINANMTNSLAWNGQIIIASGYGGNTYGYSSDGINWSGLGTIINTGALQYPKSLWNGRLFINGNPNGGTNSIATSYNGINWLGQGTSIQSFDIGFNARRPHSIQFQRNLTIATGNSITSNTLAYSTDGVNWNTINTSFVNSANYPFVYSSISGLSYNGKLWICGCYNTSGNSIAVSTNGINWTGIGTFGFSQCYQPFWYNNLWLIGGSGSQSIAYSYDGYTWIGVTNSNNIFSSCYAFSYNGSVYTACGSGTYILAYSYNGINWYGISASVGNTTFLNNITCNGTIFVGIGGGGGAGNNFIYSYNGINWKQSSSNLGSASNGYSVTWNGTYFLGFTTGLPDIFTSYDGINWSGLNQYSTINGGSITKFKSITWNGTCWVCAQPPQSVYSYDGVNFYSSPNISNFTDVFGVYSNYGVKPIPFIQHPTLAFGSGTVNTMAYSPDGISWTSLGKTVFSTQGITAFWNGSIWLAGGQGTNTLAYSYDGIIWTGISNPITTSVTGIIYNGNTWVITGTGANTVAYSNNGATWNGTTLSNFTGGGSVFWNGTVFMITQGVSGNAYYSTTGTSWTQMSSTLSNAVGCPASNGYTWVCPLSTSPGLTYINQSNPGTTTWTPISTTVFTTQGYCVCYNGPIWVAGGIGSNSLAWSTDGINWNGLGTKGTSIFPNGCNSICWNGTRFIGTGSNYIGYSPDGINWYSALSTNLFTNGYGIASNPGVGGFVAPSAMFLNNNGIRGNGIFASQTLEIVSSDPYYQLGFDNVSITINNNGATLVKYSSIYYFQTASIMYGCYSTRLVVPSYTGPVFNVTRSIDNTSIDFYADATQSYLTVGLNNTGTTYASWATGSSTVYVNIWYDQSGKNNHCTQSIQANKPTIVFSSNKYLVYFNNPAAACYMNITTPNAPYTILSEFNNLTTNTYNTIACLNTTGNPGNNNGDFEVRFVNNTVVTSSSNSNDWFYSQSGTKYNYVNGISTTSITIGPNYNTLGLSASIVSTKLLGVVGTDGYDPKGRGMNGYMTEFIMYNTPLQPIDLINYNNFRLI